MMWAMKKPFSATALAALVALVATVTGGLLTGCATFASLNDGCPGVYSGVKYNRAYEETDNLTWRRDPDQELLLLLDLPFSAALDTVLLPYTAFAQPRKRPAGGAGCEAVVDPAD